MKDLLDRLVAHMRWADAIVAVSLAQDPVPETDASRLFAHILGAEELWYSRIRGLEPRVGIWPALSPDECVELANENASEYEALLARATDETVAETVIYQNSAGKLFRNSIADIITQVAMHGSYHRGQIAREMRRAGRDPAYTDFIAFARRDQ